MTRYCFCLDLVDDTALIAEYEAYHKKVWPGILESILGAGINNLEIYRFGNRLIMIMETAPHFSLEQKAAADENDPLVQQWETLMWKYQQALPQAKPGEKWMQMNKIFDLRQQAAI